MKLRPPGRDQETRRQVAVLPMRGGQKRGLEVLLVTSRETRRWIIPKGWPMKGLKRREAAMQEAYEEAGLVGQVGKRPLGYYLYDKRLKNGSAVPCLVEVFPMLVRKRVKSWPEQAQRDDGWFGLAEAADAVSEPGLAAIIRALGNRRGDLRKILREPTLPLAEAGAANDTGEDATPCLDESQDESPASSPSEPWPA